MEYNDEAKESVIAGGAALSDHIKEAMPVDYIRTVNAHLKSGNQKDAYDVLQQAVVLYPDDPFILSYYGTLQAIADKKYRSGIENCTRAIVLFRKKSFFGEVERFPVFYLNLGRVYLAAGKKKDAIDAFKKGLQYNGGYNAILKKLKKLGMRNRPPVPFLDRSNPINKYLGMVLRQEKKKLEGGVMMKSRGQSSALRDNSR